MEVLVVEDDQDFIDELRTTLSRLDGPPNVTVVRSRDTALARLEDSFFDLIVLDLKIPTIDDALDSDPAYGRAVFARAQQFAPGTPVFVLTGSPAEDFIPDMLGRTRQVDIWGEGQEVGTVTFLRKSSFSEALTILIPFARAVERLSEVEFMSGNTNPTIEDDRLIRIFSRRVSGVRCVGSLIGGGLFSAKVVRLKVTDVGGARIHDAVVKLGSIAEIRDEADRFDKHISKLEPSATPRKLQMLEFGAKSRAAAFYGLMDEFHHDAFQVCTREGGFSNTVVKNAMEATRRWWEGVPETRKSITDIRRRLISDSQFWEAIKPYPILWIQEFERKEIQVRWCSCHGDLHGGNVLVTNEGNCVLIDYGDVGEGPASLDPVTLELSLLYHPRQPLRGSGWPSKGQAAHWANLSRYLVGCPSPEFIRTCREWAHTVAAGHREVAAVAYSYLVRQLKYSDSDKELTMELLDAVHNWFSST